jgi:hypothetical protein
VWTASERAFEVSRDLASAAAGLVRAVQFGDQQF